MFRGILYLIISVLVISVLRSVIGIIAKAFTQGMQSGGSASTAKRRPVVEAGGELKKDPVCGTFIATATSIKKTFHGETYYFCSAECRDKFRA